MAWQNKTLQNFDGRVERVSFWPSPPPHQTVRTDFPYTAFAVPSSEAVTKEIARTFTDDADLGRAREHRRTSLPVDGRGADFAA